MLRLLNDVPCFADLFAGEALTRQSVRVGLLFYALAGVLMLRLDHAGWAARSPLGWLARLAWSLGWLAYIIHVALAFHHFHAWSHTQAVAHVESVSGFGPGIFVSYLFTLLWSIDVFWWWLSPAAYAGRPDWVGWVWHGFFAFVAFNATVVFETGFIRICGIVLFVVLAAALALRVRTLSLQGEVS